MVFLGLLCVPFGLLANQSVDQQLRVLVQKAQAAEQKDDLEEAAALYRQMLKIRPHWASAEFNLGLVCHSQKKYFEAIRLMTEVIRHRPAFADAYLFRGIGYYRTDQHEKALASLKRCLQLEPSNAEAHFYLAATYYGLDDYENAAGHYLEQIKIAPRQADLYYYLAECYFALAAAGRPGYDRLAQEAVTKLADLAPDSQNLFKLSARAFEQSGRPADAESQYREALARSPDDPATLIEYGKFKSRLREFDQAIGLLEKALALDPYEIKLRALLGEVHLMKDQPELAIPYFRAALEAKPQDEQSRIYLAQCLSKLESVQEAIAILEAAPADADGRIHYALGTYYARQGQKEKAARAIEIFRERRKRQK